MGRAKIDSSPESDIEIKVQPRGTDPHPAVSSSPYNNFDYNNNNNNNNQQRASQFYFPAPQPPPNWSPPQKQHGGGLFRHWLPWLVPLIIIVNIALFVYAMYLNDCPRNSPNNCIGASLLGRYAFQTTKENPLLGPSAATLLKMGALEVQRVVEGHQVWRIASCMWLHAGVFHVLANMLSLLFVGIRLEQEFGFVRIGVVYVISGIGGSLLSSLFVRNTISVGASGALFGLLGAMLSELLTNWTIYENKLAALSTLVFIIIINLAVGILPHVDNFAHFGGFVTGFLLGFVVLIRPQFGWVNQKNAPPGYYAAGAGRPPKYSKYKVYQYMCLFLAVIIVTAGFLAGLTLLLRGVDGNDHCPWCHYLSCIPTPFWTCEARCTSSQYQNQVNLTCMSNHKSGFYVLHNGSSTPEIQRLCTELCS